MIFKTTENPVAIETQRVKKSIQRAKMQTIPRLLHESNQLETATQNMTYRFACLRNLSNTLATAAQSSSVNTSANALDTSALGVTSANSLAHVGQETLGRNSATKNVSDVETAEYLKIEADLWKQFSVFFISADLELRLIADDVRLAVGLALLPASCTEFVKKVLYGILKRIRRSIRKIPSTVDHYSAAQECMTAPPLACRINWNRITLNLHQLRNILVLMLKALQ